MRVFILCLVHIFWFNTWAWAQNVNDKTIQRKPITVDITKLTHGGQPAFFIPGSDADHQLIPVIKINLTETRKDIEHVKILPGDKKQLDVFKEGEQSKFDQYAPIGAKVVAKSGQAFIIATAAHTGDILRVFPVVLEHAATGAAIAEEVGLQLIRAAGEALPEALPKAEEISAEALVELPIVARAIAKLAAGAAALTAAGAVIGLSPEGVGLVIVCVLTAGVGAYEAYKAPKGQKMDAFFDAFQKSVTVTIGYVDVNKSVTKGLYQLGKNGDSSIEGSYVWNATHYDASQDPIQVRQAAIRRRMQENMARDGMYDYTELQQRAYKKAH